MLIEAADNPASLSLLALFSLTSVPFVASAVLTPDVAARSITMSTSFRKSGSPPVRMRRGRNVESSSTNVHASLVVSSFLLLRLLLPAPPASALQKRHARLHSRATSHATTAGIFTCCHLESSHRSGNSLGPLPRGRPLRMLAPCSHHTPLHTDTCSNAP